MLLCALHEAGTIALLLVQEANFHNSFFEFIHSKIKFGSVLNVASGLRVKNYKQNDRSRCSNQSIWIQTEWGDKGAGYW